MNKNFLLFCLILLPVLGGEAQKIRDMFLHIDSTDYIENRRVVLSITLVKKRGKQVVVDQTSSRSDWKNIRVDWEGLTNFNKGLAYFDINQVNPDKRTCKIRVTEEKSGISKEISFELPYIRKVIILSNQLTVNRLTDLNFQLEMCNGRIINRGGSMLNWNGIGAFSDACNVAVSGAALRPEISTPLLQNEISIRLVHLASNRLMGEGNFILSYPNKVVWDLSGRSGNNGYSGSPGSFPSGDASSGSDGGSGSDAESLTLMAYIQTLNERSFMIIRGRSSGGTLINEVLDLNQIQVEIRANGGFGGNGGSGGNGGNGQIDTEKNIDSPRGGNGGNAGSGGNGGDAGAVRVFLHEEAYPFASSFKITNYPGTAGVAGQPGNAGKGDYSKSKLLGTVLSLKDGRDGKPGIDGQPGNHAAAEVLQVSALDFDRMLKEPIKF